MILLISVFQVANIQVWAEPPVLGLLCFFSEMLSCFMPGVPWTTVPPRVLPHIAGISGVCLHPHLLLVEMGSCELLPGSGSWLAKITSLSCCILFWINFCISYEVW
jgi:hypothetical protein